MAYSAPGLSDDFSSSCKHFIFIVFDPDFVNRDLHCFPVEEQPLVESADPGEEELEAIGNNGSRNNPSSVVPSNPFRATGGN